MKRYSIYIIPIIAILGLFACTNTPPPPAQETFFFHVEKDYFRYGESQSFTTEFGTVIHRPSGDSTWASYCRDSILMKHAQGGPQMNRNQNCYKKKELFINGAYQIQKTDNPIPGTFRYDTIKSYFTIEVDNDPFTLYKLESVYTKDAAGDTVVMHSIDYQSERLGSVLRIDENFLMRRRRIVSLADSDQTPRHIIKAIVGQVMRDSADWVAKKPDGTPYF